MANARARSLRKNMSDAERKLWHRLRGKQIDGVRFRRQHPIGPYIVDFVCLERRVIVEVDGGQHTDGARMARDARRDQWFQAEGYRVVRVATTEVYDNIAAFLDALWASVRELASVRAPPDHPHQDRHRT